ncbi:MAG: hypothetical protein ACRDLM_04810 [Gaiellaceae bacterium]
MLVRAGAVRLAFVPGLSAGGLFLVVALVFGWPALGAALWLAGGSYVAFAAGVHHGLDTAAPLVAVLLLLCGELAAWSLDERWPIRADAQLVWRRAGAVALLALGGLAVATLVVSLAAVPPSHGLVLTLAGALAAVGAAATGILLARR